MKRPREVIKPRWGVYALRKKAEKIGPVNAKGEQEVFKLAFKECAIPERDRWRISVQREAWISVQREA